MPLPRGLRRECEDILAGIPLPEPFTVDGFLDVLREHRGGRPIHLQALPDLGPDAPCGLWIALPEADLVYYEEHTSPAHQDLIKLHELGHVICGHARPLDAGPTLDRLFPDLSPHLLRTVLGDLGELGDLGDLGDLGELGDLEDLGDLDADGLAALRPGVLPRAMGRTDYTTREEQQAEMIALLLADLGDADRQHRTPTSRRLTDSLVHPVTGGRTWRRSPWSPS